jgi:hypothetical protein
LSALETVVPPNLSTTSSDLAICSGAPKASLATNGASSISWLIFAALLIDSETKKTRTEILAGFMTVFRTLIRRPVSPSLSPTHLWRAIRFHRYRVLAKPTPRHNTWVDSCQSLK